MTIGLWTILQILLLLCAGAVIWAAWTELPHVDMGHVSEGKLNELRSEQWRVIEGGRNR